MRDIWDKKRKEKMEKENKRYRILPQKIEKHHLDYLAREKVFLETKDEITKAFADYENRLGDAGFSKI
ncbi:MAG: hypothetical protein ABH805_02385 [Candidatus Nealsonbacteria bacterium]